MPHPSPNELSFVASLIEIFPISFRLKFSIIPKIICYYFVIGNIIISALAVQLVIGIDHKSQQKHMAVKINYCVHTWLHLCRIAMITSLDGYRCLPECSWLHKSQLRSLPVLWSHCIASCHRENRPSGWDSCSRDVPLVMMLCWGGLGCWREWLPERRVTYATGPAPLRQWQRCLAFRVWGFPPPANNRLGQRESHTHRLLQPQTSQCNHFLSFNTYCHLLFHFFISFANCTISPKCLSGKCKTDRDKELSFLKVKWVVFFYPISVKCIRDNYYGLLCDAWKTLHSLSNLTCQLLAQTM